MQRRQMLYVQPAGEPSTFAADAQLPALPLPTLDATLDRYYESLRPFGSAAELRHSHGLIESFRSGAGRQLHGLVEQRAAEQRNWVERWWEDYAYCADRRPLMPYANMHGVYFGEQAGWPQTPELHVKNMAQIIYSTIEYWDLIRNERMRPNRRGDTIHSSFMLKRVFNTTRQPGEPLDRVVSYFSTLSDTLKSGQPATPSHVVVIGKGRFFSFDVLDAQTGHIKQAQEFVPVLEQIIARLDGYAGVDEYPVAILTSADRTTWAQSRQRLVELSAHNARLMELIESSIFIVSIDEHEPADYAAACQQNLCGDLHSRWADKSSTVIAYRNGRFGCSGEHACYDGTLSIGFMVFTMMSMTEMPTPDWSDRPKRADVPQEWRFELDDGLREVIASTRRTVEAAKFTIQAACSPFESYGKTFLKQYRLHPDSFVQMIIQLVYYKMHNEFVATYETALMANYYNGRTETLRSCNLEATEWVRAFLRSDATDAEKVTKLRRAVNRHNDMMNEARNGKGIDRHLFGLWCAAFEADLPIPELFDDPLYKRSGGGGNFVLSSSTLGYTLACGYVAPMCLDGYGLFYSIIDDAIIMHVLSMRDSAKTSANKFRAIFDESLLEVRDIVIRTAEASAKL